MKLKEKIIFAGVLILIVSLSRIIPHYPNFTALGGVALFAGAKFGRRIFAFIVPLAALFLSDLLLNNLVFNHAFPERFGGFTIFDPASLWIYAAIAGIVLLSIVALRRQTTSRTIGVSIGASTLFFIVTNFGVWAGNTLYPMSPEGIIACYTAALPFYWNTLLGDLFFVAILFGGYELAASYIPGLRAVQRA